MLNNFTQFKGSKCPKRIKLRQKKKEHNQHKHQTTKRPELFQCAIYAGEYNHTTPCVNNIYPDAGLLEITIKVPNETSLNPSIV